MSSIEEKIERINEEIIEEVNFFISLEKKHIVKMRKLIAEKIELFHNLNLKEYE